MASITLTTDYNEVKVTCNGKAIKQIWLKEGDKTKRLLYQAWKIEEYQQPHYSSELGLSGSGILTATSEKVFIPVGSNSGSSYVIYSFTPDFDIDSSIKNNGSYIKFYYYDPSGTLKAFNTGVYGDDTSLFKQTFVYKTIYRDDSTYDQKGYTGKILIIPSTAVVTSSSASTTDGTTITAAVTCPNVTNSKSYTSSINTGWKTATAYAGVTTYTTEKRAVEDND